MRDHMDPHFAEALEERYTELVATSREAFHDREQAPHRAARYRSMWVTAAVGLVVIIAAVLAVRAGQDTASPAVAPTSTSVPKNSRQSTTALSAKLPKQPYGQVIHTWTDRDTSNVSGPFSFIGRTAVIAAVCDGGGAIMITDAGGSRHEENCNFLDVQQPFAKFNLGGDNKSTKTTGPVHVTVKVLSGTPQYFVRLWAVDPRILDASTWSIARTSPTVPASLRTCTAADLTPTATVARATGTSSGIITITSRSTTDCAIRSWPTMQYLAADGTKIGPLQGKDNNGKSLDSSEGSVNKYGEFPPARLTAGGDVYVIVDLALKQNLLQEDAQARTAATPTSGPSLPPTPPCDPRQVRSIRLEIGSAPVTITTPTAPEIGACTTNNRIFGVNPVMAEHPNIGE